MKYMPQFLLPLPKRSSHRFGDCFFFVRQNLSEARACRASSPSAAGGRCSEARMAQWSKYGVILLYFGHRKRVGEATSSLFVYYRQSCGDNYCFCLQIIQSILINIRVERIIKCVLILLNFYKNKTDNDYQFNVDNLILRDYNENKKS